MELIKFIIFMICGVNVIAGVILDKPKIVSLNLIALAILVK